MEYILAATRNNIWISSHWYPTSMIGFGNVWCILNSCPCFSQKLQLWWVKKKNVHHCHARASKWISLYSIDYSLHLDKTITDRQGRIQDLKKGGGHNTLFFFGPPPASKVAQVPNGGGGGGDPTQYCVPTHLCFVFFLSFFKRGGGTCTK